MIELNKTLSLIFINCIVWLAAECQNPNNNYRLHIEYIDKDSSFNSKTLQIQTTFTSQFSCITYINTLPVLLAGKGYPTASVDSIFHHETFTGIKLFLGKQYRWIKLTTSGIDNKAKDESKLNESFFTGKLFDIQKLQTIQQNLLNYYEKNGYPFAEVFLDSIRFDGDKMEAILKANPKFLYYIDSIQILGNTKISRNFLYHYLNIVKKEPYNSEKLKGISKKIIELPYLRETQPNEIAMLGSGSVLRLYLAPKRSSQVNFLIGLLPRSDQNSKLQLTADVNLNLKNVLNYGEIILLNWQQLQPQSPRLNIGYQHPYIFNSSFGIDFSFNLFKKDSTFLQTNAQIGVQYILSASQSGKIFAQWQNTFLLGAGVDTNFVIATKQLPANIDFTAVNTGIEYEWNTTDYKLNPGKGNEAKVIVSAGIKNIKRNNEILNIKASDFNYARLYDTVKNRSYQFRMKAMFAHYFPLGKQAVVKTAFNMGIFNSYNIFRNEIFQIGGYKLMRGFNEESIYATQYSVVNVEYRYKISLNSFLFTFIDGGWIRNKYQAVNTNNTFLGVGLGLNFETKFGLLNVTYAVGKRNDVKFNLREASKIHFGYVTYF